MTADGVELRLLGPPQLVIDGRPVLLRNRRGMAALARLALDDGPISRPALAHELWPDATSERAAGSLRVVLHRVREALGPHRALVRADRHTIELVRASAVLRVDTDSFDGCGGPTPTALMGVVGRELLEGIDIDDAPGFEDWLTGERLRWQGILTAAAERACRELIASEHPEVAAEIAANWVGRDPYAEQAAVSLTLARAACGRHDAAAAAWATWCRTCREDLGAEPSPEACRRVDSTIAAAPTTATAAPIANSRPGPVADPVAGLRYRPLIGRTRELSTLGRSAELAADGRPVVAIVEAPMGVGKTRLLDEFAIRLEHGDAPVRFDVITGRAHEAGGRIAFGMIVDGLRRRLERENAPDDLVDDVWLYELSRLLPELLVRYPDLRQAPAIEPRLASHRVFEAVACLVEALCRQAPVAFLLDDVHRADASSVDLLAHVVRAAEQRRLPVLIVAALRPDEGDPALAEWLAGLPADVRQPTLELDALSEHEAGALFEDPSDGLAARLHEHTSGNALFLDAVVRSLVGSGRLTTDPLSGLLRSSDPNDAVDELPVPPELLAVLRSQLRELSPVGRHVAAAIAIVDGDGGVDALGPITRLDEIALLDEVDALVSAGLVDGPDPRSGAVTVSHDAVRQAAILEAGPARRRVLHQRTLVLLDDLPAARRAYHAAAAGDPTAAVRSWCDAIEESNRGAAWQTAARHVNAALGLLDRAEPDETYLIRLLRGAEPALLLAGRPGDCASMLATVAAHADRLGLSPVALEARLRHIELRLMPTALSDRDGARRALDELGAASGELDEVSRARIDAVRVADIYWSAGGGDGLGVAERALPHLLGDAVAPVRLGVLNATIAFGIWEGNRGLVERRAIEVREGWASIGETWAGTRTYFLVNFHRALAGDLAAAAADLSEGLERSRATHDRWHRVVLAEVEAMLSLERDDAEGALAIAEECAAVCDDGPFRSLAYAVLPSLVEARLAVGDRNGALAAIDWFVQQRSEGVAGGRGNDGHPLVTLTESMSPIAAASLLGAGIAALLANEDLAGAIELDRAAATFDLSARPLTRIDLLIRARARLAAYRCVCGDLSEVQRQAVRTQLAAGAAAADARGHDLVRWGADAGLVLIELAGGDVAAVDRCRALAREADAAGWRRRARLAAATVDPITPLEALLITKW